MHAVSTHAMNAEQRPELMAGAALPSGCDIDPGRFAAYQAAHPAVLRTR
jgi:hypothetical protein